MSTQAQPGLRQDNGPTCGFVSPPRWAQGPLSVPLDWGITSCYIKTRIVIRNYVLRSWAESLGSGSISPDQQSRTRFPLGAGPVSPRVLAKGALSQTAGGPGPPTGSRTPMHCPDPSAGRETDTPLEGVQSCHVSADTGTRSRNVSPGRLATYCIQCGRHKCALLWQSPRRLLPGCTVDRMLPRRTVQPPVPSTPRLSVCYAS